MAKKHKPIPMTYAKLWAHQYEEYGKDQHGAYRDLQMNLAIICTPLKRIGRDVRDLLSCVSMEASRAYLDDHCKHLN